MSGRYTPYDYNRHVVLRLPFYLGAAMVYLSKYIFLFVVPRLPRLNRDGHFDFLENNDVTHTDLGLVLAGLPALALLIVALVRRVPDAGQPWRWIWENGRTLLIASASLELVLMVVYVAIGRRQIDEVVVAFAYLDIMILVYLIKSRRVVDLFNDFPKPSATASVVPPARAGKRRFGVPATTPTLLSGTKVAIVHLGGDPYLELDRDVILGIYSSLNALQYDTIISPNFLHTGRLNLIIGFGRAQRTTREQLREKNIDYMIYETEAVHYGKPNDPPATGLDVENDYLPALSAAKLVMSPFKHVILSLGRMDFNARYIRWGYVPELTEIDPLPDERKSFDCYFYGQITTTRRHLLNTLVEGGLSVKASAYPGLPTFLRNHFISRSKLVLSLRPGEHSPTVNPYRIMYAVQNGYCVVSEHQEQDLDGYNAYGCETGTEDLGQYCRDLIDSGDYKNACDENKNRLLAEPLTEYFRGVI